MAIGVSHGGQNIYASDARTDEVLVGTKDGVVLLQRRGAGWDVAQRSLAGMHISAILPEPESGTIFAGAFFGSIYASTDSGRSWQERCQGLGYHDVYSLGVKKLANGTVRLYAGTEPANLFQSDDLGARWTLVPALRE